MPQIIVAADRGAAFGEGTVTFRERVNVSDFESEHFAVQLLERLGWAVEDADVVERRQEPKDSSEVVERRAEQPAATAELVREAEVVREAEPVHEEELVREEEPGTAPELVADEPEPADEAGLVAEEPDRVETRLEDSAAVHVPA